MINGQRVVGSVSLCGKTWSVLRAELRKKDCAQSQRYLAGTTSMCASAHTSSAHTGAEEILAGMSCCLVSLIEEYIGRGWLCFFFALTHLLDVGSE